MNDPAAGLSVLHVIVRAGATNSQYNEHCLPVLGTRQVTVCSLFPADVTPPTGLTLFEGDGTKRGCVQALRQALAFDHYDVVHVHAPASGVLTLAVYLMQRRDRHDLVFTVHNSWGNFRRRNRLFLRLVMALFTTVVVCGRSAYDSLPRRLRRSHAEKLAVVPNGVDLDRVDAVVGRVNGKARNGHDGHNGDDALTVASVNRLIPLKDPLTLLDAFARVRRPGDRLVYVGEGPLRGAVLDRTNEHRLSGTVTLTGLVPRDEVYRTLARSDVYVSPSGGEGLPVAMLEAMACGRPVVVSDIPPHREVARVAGDIPLVRVGDDEGFARALEQVRALGPEGRRALGGRLRRAVAEHFTVRTMNEAYGEVYRRLAAGEPLHPVAREGTEHLPLGHKLRRRLALVLTVSLLGGAAGYVYAFTQTPVYKAETTLLVGSTPGSSADEESLQVSTALAATYADLARREPVLRPVAEQGFAATWRELQAEVHAQTGDKNARLVQLSAYADDATEATALATALADRLVEVVAEGAATPRQDFLREQLAALETYISETTAELAAVRALLDQVQPGPVRPAPAAPGTPAPDPGIEELRQQEAALRGTLLELQGSFAELQPLGSTRVGQLQRVDEAWVTRSPLRPTPVMLALAGLGAGLAAATGWVHLMDRGADPQRPAPVRPLLRHPAPSSTRRRAREHPDGPAPSSTPSDAWADPETFWAPDTVTTTKGSH